MKSKYKIKQDNMKNEQVSLREQWDDLKTRIREFYPYFLGFYFLSLVIALFSKTWRLFFYWSAMHGSIIFFTLLFFAAIDFKKFRQQATLDSKLEKQKLNLFFKFKILFSALADSFNNLIIKQGTAFFLFLKNKIGKVTLITWIKVAFIAAVLILALCLDIGVLEFIILGYGLISVIFILESRWPAIAAVIFLGLCPIFLILKKDGLAEVTSIYAYYFLIIVVLTQIRDWSGKYKAN
jgi:hypothetical protein